MPVPSDHDSATGLPDEDASLRGARENFCERLENYIESNPFRSMAIALVAGIAVAKLLL